MSLTLEIEHRLKSKGFDDLYEGHAEKWIEMAAKAKEYCETFITAGETIRPGDISENLQNAIKTDTHFEGHVKAWKLKEKYWIRYFSDYILDKIYPPHVAVAE